MSGPVPAPRPPLDPLVELLPAGCRLWRVHPPSRRSVEFSTSTRPTRFGPLFDAGAVLVPIWCGADSEEGAIFESVFHDVPVRAAHPRVLYRAFADRLLSPVVTAVELRLIDLSSIGLRRLRIRRTHLIESTSNLYDRTRAWAIALRAADPLAQGMRWVARQSDVSRAVVLFADRVPADVLEPDPGAGAPYLLGTGSGLRLVERFALRADITIVAP